MVKLAQKNNNKNDSNNANIIDTIPLLNKAKKRTRKTIPRDSPPQRSSIYRGVTRHRWTGRYEAHLWDKNCWNEAQNKKGRQVYLGAYDDEAAAAHAYDLAALKYWGPETILNFPLATYQKELKEMEGQSREEYIGSLRRKSSGFSRGVSKYRGVARHHHNGRWEARIGRVFGNKYLYLGTYATQEEAAIAYDMAAIEYRGLNAVTNFDLSRYIKWLKPDNNNNNNNNNNNSVTDSNPSDLQTSNLTPEPSHSFELVNTSYNHQNDPLTTTSATGCEPFPPPRPTTATSALSLLLQSSKFKELMEMNMAAECTSEQTLESDPPQCSFPDDVMTQFEGFGSNGDHDAIFGDLDFFMQPMLQFNSLLSEEVSFL